MPETVNVTERTPTDWNAINWRKVYQAEKNLRQRIFKASRQGDLKKVRSLQKLMLRSYSNRLAAVRRVTQVNKGKDTPGTDKLLVKTPERRAWLADWLANYEPWKAKPARRVYIPKANGKLRPLGIPSIVDRAIQAMVKNALEPFWEARFEGTSYGFRPGRSCHDAIMRTWQALKRKRKLWVLDADIKGAFDNIDHDHLLNTVGNFPARELIRQWLKAGYVDEDVFYDTEKGTPQGGVISPLLANIALHGMEEALGITHDSKGYSTSPRTLVRYADDFVVITWSQEDAEKAKSQLSDFLKERGLWLNDEKTRTVHATEGFDFLGFNVRIYDVTPHRPPERKRWKLLIKPSDDSVRRIKEKLRKEWKKALGKPIRDRIPDFNRIIRGWANYYRSQVSARTFEMLDHWMYQREVRWVVRTHKVTVKRCHDAYWGRFNSQRGDNWVFGDKKTGTYIWKFRWTAISRRVMVKGTASPDDPQLKDYWESRIKAKAEGLPVKKQRIARNQDHKCWRCGEDLDNDEELQMHRIDPSEGYTVRNTRLVHYYCHQQTTAEQHAAGRLRGRARAG